MNIKKQLYDYCLAYVLERIENAEKAINTARESANDDTKSSAGDKYETGRAMMQQEIDRYQIQLNEARKLQQILDRLSIEQISSSVAIGSLVITNKGNFYIVISAGQIILEGKTYFAVSAASPIGLALLNKKSGDSFTFNGKEFTIQEVL